MKRRYLLLACLALCGTLDAQQLSGPPSGDNQKARVTQWIGPVEVTIDYSSPDVHDPQGNDRTGKIWGTNIAHYGYVDQGFGAGIPAPWRAGANENTTITFSHAVRIGGQDLGAGKYGLFLAVAEKGPWTWVFSKNSSSWGSYFYDPKEDALRADVTPLDAQYTEFLTYGFEDRKPSSAVAFLQWENKKIPMKIEVPGVVDLYVAAMRNELKSSPGFDPRNFSAAASYCAANKTNLEEALVWANKAMDPNLGGTEDFPALQAKGQVLMAMGKTADYEALMDKAIKLPSAGTMAVHQYGRSLLASGNKEKALEVFLYNFKAHPEDKFTPTVGLARGYSAVGDKKNAIKYWELAIKNIPENQKTFYAPVFEEELKKARNM
jgi:tetratricopeptide (TPR) repeat protein